MSTTRRSAARLKSSSSKVTSSLLMPTAQYHTELEKTRQEAVAMKSRIRSLELEVETLKQRLDGLRKAKNTTIIKREREEIHIQPPTLGRHYSMDTTSAGASRYSLISNSQTVLEEKQLLQEQLSQKDNELKESREQIARLSTDRTKLDQRLETLTSEHDQLMKQMKNKLLETELALSKKETEQSQEINIHVKCVAVEEKEDLLKELDRMRSENKELASQLSDLIDANVTLRESNELMQGKCELLMEDLSLKEAKWAEKEQQLQAEIRRQWGERYHQWITKAEQKMEELQKVNVILQSLLKTKAHNPDLQ